MKRFWNAMCPSKDGIRNRRIYLVIRTGWQEDIDGWEAVAGEEIPYFYPERAVSGFVNEVKKLGRIENVYRYDEYLTVYGDSETVTLVLWDGLEKMYGIRYRVVRGQTIFTCGTEEEVLNYLKGATRKEPDPDTLVIDRTEYIEQPLRYPCVRFYFHLDGTEGVTSYIELYDMDAEHLPPPEQAEPETFPF